MTEKEPVRAKKLKIAREPKKRLPKGQRTHNRRLKQEAGKMGPGQA